VNHRFKEERKQNINTGNVSKILQQRGYLSYHQLVLSHMILADDNLVLTILSLCYPMP
jgi:hypothetical protein